MKTINNKPFWYDSTTCQSFHKKPKGVIAEYWDSVLEFKVYETLLKHFPLENIKRQDEIIIWEKTSVFPKLSWVIDFKIFGVDSKPLYIEAKGKWLLEHPENQNFWKTLKLLQIFHPAIFNNLLIVGDNTSWMIPRTKMIVHPYKDINQLIKVITPNG